MELTTLPNKKRWYRSGWVVILAFALAWFGFVHVLRVSRTASQLPSVWQAVGRLEKLHPKWKFRQGGGELRQSCYILAQPYPKFSTSDLPPFLADGSAEEVDEHPFEGDAWRRVVFARLYLNRESEPRGWHGHVLIKGRFLFYGDQDMLREIDEDWN